MKSLAIAYGLKKKTKKMAEGGEAFDSKKKAEKEAQKGILLHDLRESVSQGTYRPEEESMVGRSIDKIKGMANGGMIRREEDMIDRLMKERMMSKGGMVANDVPNISDEMPNNFDDLSLRDELEFSYTGKNSGDELSSPQEDSDRDDMIAQIMKSRRKKDRMPHPA